MQANEAAKGQRLLTTRMNMNDVTINVQLSTTRGQPITVPRQQ